ncbi:serine/threonine-protein kinase 33-like [Schistocerca serialis cubense]|uniref:serine/threonine-protein kinase 33-like n=1 Tax=Schistocerca serialis cubense TaxID=2023355 RepID=UPI00214EFBC5|nr:serine/threonine-protein kinase 33-like [Schistocerca serialis cubense]
MRAHPVKALTVSSVVAAHNSTTLLLLLLHLEIKDNLYLVLELCTGTLAKEFYERRPFSEADTREVIRKLASAVAYLHSNGIVHRDLKLENILLTTNPDDPEDKLYIKVTDFGQSVVRSGVAYDQMLHERCGTMAYMAPEVMELRMYSHQCDVWSMGVITYLLLVGDFPFTGDSPEQLRQRVLNDELRFGRKLLSNLLDSSKYAFSVKQQQSEIMARTFRTSQVDQKVTKKSV